MKTENTTRTLHLSRGRTDGRSCEMAHVVVSRFSGGWSGGAVCRRDSRSDPGGRGWWEWRGAGLRRRHRRIQRDQRSTHHRAVSHRRLHHRRDCAVRTLGGLQQRRPRSRCFGIMNPAQQKLIPILRTVISRVLFTLGTGQKIGWKEHPRNNLFYVDWDEKP